VPEARSAVRERRPGGFGLGTTVVLLSRDEAYAVRALVVVAPATTTVRGFAAEVKVGRREGLRLPCVVNCDWLVTIPKVDLLSRAGALSGSKMRQLDDALRFALGLD
jgi:mRNA interferase MazF